jgi:hypothetical protein
VRWREISLYLSKQDREERVQGTMSNCTDGAKQNHNEVLMLKMVGIMEMLEPSCLRSGRVAKVKQGVEPYDEIERIKMMEHKNIGTNCIFDFSALDAQRPKIRGARRFRLCWDARHR